MPGFSTFLFTSYTKYKINFKKRHVRGLEAKVPASMAPTYPHSSPVHQVHSLVGKDWGVEQGALVAEVLHHVDH